MSEQSWSDLSWSMDAEIVKAHTEVMAELIEAYERAAAIGLPFHPEALALAEKITRLRSEVAAMGPVFEEIKERFEPYRRPRP